MYTVLQKHHEAIILCFLLKLCYYECGWGKLYDLRHVKNCKILKSNYHRIFNLGSVVFFSVALSRYM